MGKKDERTNVMRVLESMDVKYEAYTYDYEGKTAVDIAETLGQNPESLFKTLVTVGKSGEHYVFMIPCINELDLKKAASAAGEKSVEMIPQKELFPLTGYIHGGCSPIGMKKQFDTFIDETAVLFDRICYSAGKPGYQVKTSPLALVESFNIHFAELTK